MEKVLARLGTVSERASEEVGTVFLPTPDTLVLDSIQWIPIQFNLPSDKLPHPGGSNGRLGYDGVVLLSFE